MHELSKASNHKFKYVASRRAIVCKKTDKTLTGLHPTLNGHFWPRYKKQDANRGCTRPRSGPFMKTFLFKPPTTRRARNNIQQSERGKKFGIKIDKQIEISVGLSVRYNLPCKFFYDRAVRNQHSNRIPPRVTAILSKIHLFTKRFWKALDELNWKPVASQVGVGCKKWHVATLLDVLAIDEDGRERVIEVKVGYDGYYYKCTEHNIAYPFHEREDCLYHQHMIQVAITNELYKRTYRKAKLQQKRVADPIVLRLTSKSTYVYFLTEWVKDGINILKNINTPLSTI